MQFTAKARRLRQEAVRCGSWSLGGGRVWLRRMGVSSRKKPPRTTVVFWAVKVTAKVG
jgi:hypothetical protein